MIRGLLTKIREETLKFLGSNENENTKELRGIAISKRKLKAIVLKLKTKLKNNRWKNNNDGAEIDEMETKQILQRAKDTKSSLFKNIKQSN